MMWLEVLAILGILGIAFQAYKKKLFAMFCSSMNDSMNKRLGKFKAETFRQLNEDADRAGKHKLKILEIGGGSGSNFKFIETPVDWTVSEPNVNFLSYFKENVQKHGGEHRIHDLVEARGEDLGAFAPESFDAVITTMVLCSVESIQKTLQEIKRVLKPGGRFYFVEHVGDEPGTRRRAFQDLLSKTFWPVLFDGCELNRDTERIIRKSGFSDWAVSSDISHELTSYPFARTLYGSATK